MLNIWDIFGRLVIENISPIRKWGQITYDCICSCWVRKNIPWRDLTSGNSASCGCYAIEYRKKRYTTHWESKTPFGKKYRHIMERCNNINNKSYKDYGGRGIKCEWGSLQEFRDDMYASYEAHLWKYGQSNTTIERIDVNWNYCKDNCIWVTKFEQSLNTRRTVNVILNGETMCYTHAISSLVWYRGYTSRKERRGRSHQEIIDYLVQRRAYPEGKVSIQ